MNGLTVLVVTSIALTLVSADVYMHMMRGSNNRLQASGENVQNANRLFNSQNNNKGGYNVGSKQPEEYYVGSELLFEWTAQHGCNNPKDECQIILQFMCSDTNGNPNIRDGTTEETPPDTGDGGPSFGQHEPYSYYANCKARQRNEGLYTADRRRFLDGNFYNAQYTRQNENGNRRGYECQEERDYYPYWSPTPWRDIAILVDDQNFGKMCPYYQAMSENVLGRGYCTQPQHNNQDACEEGRFYYPQDQDVMNRVRELARAQADEAFWSLRATQGDTQATQKQTDAWNRVQQLNQTINQARQARRGNWKVSAPYDPTGAIHPIRCRPLHPGQKSGYRPGSRVNHLGNSGDGQATSFLWKIPNLPADACVMRLRYNMSSSDYYSWRTWSESNGEKSPIKQNMHVEVGTYGKVELAINTHQIARTFQDRSHTFKIKTVPASLNNARIVNLNVRGKRGNIVQAYPAVEYDFHPNRATICPGDYIHFQWTGSDTNPANYAGQGTAGTDRHNIVQISLTADNKKKNVDWQAPNFQMNTPLKLAEVTMFPNAQGQNDYDVTKRFALLGQTDDLLNNAPSYFNYPPIQYNSPNQTYHYMCSRNNNFSNRSQKGFIYVNATCQANSNYWPAVHPGVVMEDLTNDYGTPAGVARFIARYGHGTAQ